MSFETPVIMVIDDEPENLHVLEHILMQNACKVVAFPRGDLALKAAHSVEPDLILLDVRMPKMNGYEVCRELKRDEKLKEVPVIFLSALSTLQDKIMAFEAGGVDYVTKPLYEREVMARVHTHLTIRRQTTQLEDLVSQRTAELFAAHRRLEAFDMAKTHWISMLAHEMRTPLTGVVCVAEMLFNLLESNPQAENLRENFNWYCNRIRKLIDDAIMLATIEVKSEGLEFVAIDLGGEIIRAQKNASSHTEGVTFNLKTMEEGPFMVLASAELLSRALSDLFFTAGCCVHQTDRVETVLRKDGNWLIVEILVRGKTLSQDAQATFFDVCEQRLLVRGGADFGLAPALALRSLQIFGGDVRVQNNGEEGFDIVISLPSNKS